MTKKNTLDDILNLDPLAITEKALGKSYKEFSRDAEMQVLGMASALNDRKKEVLQDAGDSFFSMGFSGFCDFQHS